MSRLWIKEKIVVITAEGSYGGLGLSWDPSQLNMKSLSQNSYVLSTSFHLLGTNLHGFLSNVYGPQASIRKQEMLMHIHSLNDIVDTHKWVIGGNFNIITSLREKKGGRRNMEPKLEDL